MSGLTSGVGVTAVDFDPQDVNQGSFIVNGGGVDWADTGLVYNVAAAKYYINGKLYESPATQLTLDPSDPSDDRIDVIVFNDDETVSIVKGTAADSPSEPTIDPATQVYGSFILVAAASTEPTIDKELVYADNAGSPAEWDWTTGGSGFDADSTGDPRTGTKCIEGTSVANNAYALGQRGSESIDPNTYGYLVLYIKSKAMWNSKRYLLVSLLESGVRRGNVLKIAASDTWGFDSSITDVYQAVVIPCLQFAVPSGTAIDQIKITDSGGSIGFYIDDVAFRGGVTGGSSTPGMTQSQADARYLQSVNGQALFTREGIVAATAGTLRIYNKTGKTVTIARVWACADTAPTGQAMIIDVHKDGTTIFTNQAHRAQIAAAANYGDSTDIDVPTWADGSYLTLDVDQIGSTVPGSNLTVAVVYSY